MDATQWECTNEQYHADVTKVGSTMLKTALSSPQEYYRRYIDKDDDGKPLMLNETTKPMLLGSLVHCLILEPENYDLLYFSRPDGIDARTTVGKQKLSELTAANIGKTMVDADMEQQAKAMAASVLSERIVQELMEGSIRERAVTWDEDGLPCKSKIDIWTPRSDLSTDLILDVKTSDDPSPENWSRGGAFAPICKWRIDLSLVHYERSMVAMNGRHCSTGLIVVGSSAPHDTFVYDATPWLEIGFYWWRRAMELVRNGITDNVWRRAEQDSIIALNPGQWDWPVVE